MIYNKSNVKEDPKTEANKVCYDIKIRLKKGISLNWLSRLQDLNPHLALSILSGETKKKIQFLT